MWLWANRLPSLILLETTSKLGIVLPAKWVYGKGYWLRDVKYPVHGMHLINISSFLSISSSYLLSQPPLYVLHSIERGDSLSTSLHIWPASIPYPLANHPAPLHMRTHRHTNTIVDGVTAYSVLSSTSYLHVVSTSRQILTFSYRPLGHFTHRESRAQR